jgi:hypothetical protein
MAQDSPSSSSSERRHAVPRLEPRRKSADTPAVQTVMDAERWVIALRRLRAQEEPLPEGTAPLEATTAAAAAPQISTEEAALRANLRKLGRPREKSMGFREWLQELWRQIRPSGKGGGRGTGTGRGSSSDRSSRGRGSAGSSGDTPAPAG